MHSSSLSHLAPQASLRQDGRRARVGPPCGWYRPRQVLRDQMEDSPGPGRRERHPAAPHCERGGLDGGRGRKCQVDANGRMLAHGWYGRVRSLAFASSQCARAGKLLVDAQSIC
ncbi:hypothetical protein Naga_100332g3 [Nannochloropsis gaditana]|uniref:Uncharacterized protein n=1 Tax=Nannochloropsis gaditana TaxID=72520 RepID=W7TVG8_9STRA|nr:hypothetical protein Naga_100332g3 [Nannochloropsis gaditana]